jgi:hypothetical protein
MQLPQQRLLQLGKQLLCFNVHCMDICCVTITECPSIIMRGILAMCTLDAAYGCFPASLLGARCSGCCLSPHIVAGAAVPQQATQQFKSKSCTMWWSLCLILQQYHTEVLDVALPSSLLSSA